MEDLIVRNITKIAGRNKTILHNMSFSLQQGSIAGLIGHNGAGKSTTFKIIMDLMRPTSGEVLILGEPNSNHEVFRHVGYLPETPLYPDYLTGAEFLSYMSDLLRLPQSRKKTIISGCMDRVGLGSQAGKLIRHYSKGMKQKLGIANVLLAEPSLLILDEPLSGLDPIGRHDVFSIIEQLGKEKKTILLSSHILYDLEKLCSRFIMISEGAIIDDLTGQIKDIESLYLDKVRKEVPVCVNSHQ